MSKTHTPVTSRSSLRKRRSQAHPSPVRAWLRKSASLLLLPPLVLLAAQGLRWYQAERLVLEVEASLAAHSAQLHYSAWQELQRQLTHSLELRPDNGAAL